MNFLYDCRQATRDVDCVFSEVNEVLLKSIIEEVVFIESLDSDWINDDIKEPLKELIKEDLIPLLDYSNLEIIMPIKEQLLAMKILSARPEPSKDFIDAFLLCKNLGIKEKKEVIEIFERYFPPVLLRNRKLCL